LIGVLASGRGGGGFSGSGGGDGEGCLGSSFIFCLLYEIALAFLVMSIEGCNEAAARILSEALENDDRSHDEIAGALGHDGPWLGKIARGERRVRLCDFLALADILGFDPIEAIRKIRKAR